MKKKILTVLTLLLCLVMTASAVFAAMAMAGSDSPASVENYSGQSLPLSQLAADATWNDPVYKEKDTVDHDTYEGTLTYTPSEDGSKMTISYDVNGDIRSYTVPNKYNYLSGGFVGTDDLGRELYTANDLRNKNDTIGVYDSERNLSVGLFYFLWLGEHPVNGENKAYNLQEILDSNPPEVYQNANSGVYGPLWAQHFFAEPLYGYYTSKDRWVMQKHAELLCNAGIDFLYLDYTNGREYNTNALILMSILDSLGQQGYDAPQVVFYTNSNAVSVVTTVYNTFYTRNLYPDTWFRIDGKPVIVAPKEGLPANIANFFCVKESQWPNEAEKQDAWPWMDFEWPQRVFNNADGERSAINVSVAQHQGTINFGSSAFYGDLEGFGGISMNRGRSFNSRFCVLKTLSEYRTAWNADKSLTKQGLNFQAQWDRAHEFAEKGELEYVLITGWNEWTAQRVEPIEHGKDANYVYFVDNATMEYSRDTEMMAFYDSDGDGKDDGFFDNYYMQIVQNVEKLKGDAPVVIQDGRTPINVTGDFDQWANIPVTYHDPKGDAADRNCLGFSNVRYTNTTGRNDIVASKIAVDTKNVYFYAQTAEDITMYDTESSWMQLYIDVDDSAATGWYGYDFIINYQAKDQFTTTVAKYNGTDGAYSFEVVGDVNYRVKGNEIMIEVPQTMLDMIGYLELNFQFKWADSDSTYTTMQQFYTDGDAAPLGRLNYVFQNYIPGESDVYYPDNNGSGNIDTDTDTDTDTEIDSIADTETSTQTTGGDNEDGCGSVIGTASVAIVMSAMAAAVVLKKKED